jgi:hypothetical protein
VVAYERLQFLLVEVFGRAVVRFRPLAAEEREACLKQQGWICFVEFKSYCEEGNVVSYFGVGNVDDDVVSPGLADPEWKTAVLRAVESV